ncbi:DmsE family decaheme c-type cytochrome [Uliginosibacterium sp. H3]|uniref:DmsE family decaheme c-type cytochrome n=1 Tax=Uliginosibacterium silvisoli TaxID=3114758 RepID=A0ABU6K3F4_9RHOO|nr:DmsE family decaheme c-type cytochrome [Uliginosibacterium sp. H3]
MKRSGRFITLLIGAIVIACFSGRALAADDKAAKPADLVLTGDAVCTSCHDASDDATPTLANRHPSVMAIGKTRHGTRADGRTPSCTSCHGESDQHRKTRGNTKPDVLFSKQGATPVEARNAACLSCHKEGNRIGWHTSTHGLQDLSCSSCHSVHAQRDKVREKQTQAEVCFACHKEQRNQISKASHHPVVEGKMTCSSCHNVHGDNPKMLVKASTNETCFTCHMEKRGPFVHNHQPVTEDCGICHQPHGTTIPNLLKARAPFLCQDCHSHDSHPGQAAALPNAPSNSTSMLGTVARGCLNCHTNIHGGNSTVNSATAGRFRR